MKKDLIDAILNIEVTQFDGQKTDLGELLSQHTLSAELDQLDEPETLSEEWLEENKCSWTNLSVNGYSIPVEELQNLLVPKQEEVDRAYKDGYEEGREHGFYKGYREGLANKGGEPETVADVVTTFWKSFERLKEVMSMEVEELEE